MPATRNSTCYKCAHQTIKEAQARDCYKPDKCPSLRCYYRNSARINQERRNNYKESKIKNLPQPQIVQKPYAIIYFNRVSNRANAPIDSIEVKVFQGKEAIAEIEPVIAIGWGAKEVKEYALKCVGIIGKAYDISGFARQVNRCLSC